MMIRIVIYCYYLLNNGNVYDNFSFSTPIIYQILTSIVELINQTIGITQFKNPKTFVPVQTVHAGYGLRHPLRPSQES